MNTEENNPITMLLKEHQHTRALSNQFYGLIARSLLRKKLVMRLYKVMSMQPHLEEKMFCPAVLKATKNDNLTDKILVDYAAAKQLIGQRLTMDEMIMTIYPKPKCYQNRLNIVCAQKRKFFGRSSKSQLILKHSAKKYRSSSTSLNQSPSDFLSAGNCVTSL